MQRSIKVKTTLKAVTARPDEIRGTLRDKNRLTELFRMKPCSSDP
jgi:hypothetical protein